MNNVDFDKLFNSFSSLKIGVIGDVMLDTYWWGKVDRISPEAPVPVVAVSKKEQRIGGAGNVALNLVSLGVNVHTVSIVGDDDEGNQLIDLLKEQKINADYILKSSERITTNKIRIISRNQHMMRLDAEVTNELSANESENIISAFKKYIEVEKPNLVILEDYNKGVLTENVIVEIIKICKLHNIITAVDPKRKNFFAYKGVNIFKPNLQEIKEALNIISNDVSENALHQMHVALKEKIGASNFVYNII